MGSKKVLKILSKTSFLFLLVLTFSLLVLSGCGAGSSSGLSSTPPTLPAYINISLSPAAVLPGQSATLTWTTGNATSCTGTGAWTGTIPGSGSMTVTLQGTATQAYSLLCASPGGSASKTVTLALAPADGACTTSQAKAHHGAPSRAIAAARKAVATGKAGPRRSSQK
jgi:hypothetical protein